ncbi:hypothetical protein K438DRAFT_1751004 [Mycena galopus ATCC 62051]|nr:hypothetical protein K438DRAFT_1751004 [Mycena galopus ATCC 62051]
MYVHTTRTSGPGVALVGFGIGYKLRPRLRRKQDVGIEPGGAGGARRSFAVSFRCRVVGKRGLDSNEERDSGRLQVTRRRGSCEICVVAYAKYGCRSSPCSYRLITLTWASNEHELTTVNELLWIWSRKGVESNRATEGNQVQLVRDCSGNGTCCNPESMRSSRLLVDNNLAWILVLGCNGAKDWHRIFVGCSELVFPGDGARRVPWRERSRSGMWWGSGGAGACAEDSDIWVEVGGAREVPVPELGVGAVDASNVQTKTSISIVRISSSSRRGGASQLVFGDRSFRFASEQETTESES